VLLPLISGLLTPIGKTSREALISKEATKFVVKICVNLRHISGSEFGHSVGPGSKVQGSRFRVNPFGLFHFTIDFIG
jgi:hypothetical protein